MLKGSSGTLSLFVWVFYVGSGIWAIWDFYHFASGEDPTDVFTILYLVLYIAYMLGGIYLVFNVKKLLPKYRARIVRILTIGFGAEVLLSLAYLPTVIFSPASVRPSLEGPFDLYDMVGASIVGIALSFLIYRVVVSSINDISGIPQKHSRNMTILYWVIAFGFLVAMIAAMLNVSNVL